MYIVEIKNGELTTTIHGIKDKLQSGKIVQSINTIDSFTFAMFPDNPGFNLINEFTTLVSAYNTNKEEYDFVGRVLYAETTMSESGLIVKTVTCESVAGYLCDSYQTYADTQNWTVSGLLQHLIDCHNSQVESYKQIKIGTVTATDKNDNLYQAVQRENTWDSIKSKLLDKIGGELQFRVEDDGIYLDYLDRIGEDTDTEIALSVNMKAITREQDPTAFITRLYPYGCKLKKIVETTDDEGNTKTEEVESEERLTISSVNNGLNYIDDEAAIAVYGVHVGIIELDDVTTPQALKTKGESWLAANNKVQIKYSITALDLSLLGYDYADFQLGNSHPVKNGLLAIDDTARIIKKNIDVCEETKSAMEVGDNFKTLSDIQREQAAKLETAVQQVGTIKSEMSNEMISLKNEITESYSQDIILATDELREEYTTEIQQLSDSIKLEVSGSLGSKANILLTAGANEYSYELDMSQVRKAFADDETAISISAGLITFNAGTLVINSTKFMLDSDGVITATGGTIGAITLTETGIYSNNASYSRSYAGWYRPETIKTTETCFFAGASDQFGTNAKFLVTYGGALTATDATINGSVVSVDSPYKTELDFGSLRLYWNDDLCGTINTKYWSGASTAGISLRIEEGGNYIMFSHPNSDHATGFEVDYYLNHGWSSNYDEMHIFQTSARFLDDVYFAGYTRIRSLRLFGANGEYLVGISASGQLEISKL